MEKELITTDKILNWLQIQVEQKLPVDAHTWLDACQKITVLLGDEHDKLFEMQQDLAMQKTAFILHLRFALFSRWQASLSHQNPQGAS
jgi:hypothetical protein